MAVKKITTNSTKNAEKLKLFNRGQCQNWDKFLNVVRCESNVSEAEINTVNISGSIRALRLSVGRCRDVLIDSLSYLTIWILFHCFNCCSMTSVNQLLFVSDPILSRIVSDGRIGTISDGTRDQNQAPHFFLSFPFMLWFIFIGVTGILWFCLLVCCRLNVFRDEVILLFRNTAR